MERLIRCPVFFRLFGDEEEELRESQNESTEGKIWDRDGKEGNRIRARNYRERQKALGIEKKRPKPKMRQKNLRTTRILSNKKARIS